MNQAQIKTIQKEIGTKPDGFWGPKSIAACQKYLRGLMPKPHPFPKSSQAELKKFYGDPAKGEPSKRLARINVTGLGVRMGGSAVNSISVHERCAGALLQALTEVSELDPTFSWVLQQYAGVYNHRPMRGGTSWSLHAYGAAIDLAPGANGLHTHWPTRANMPLEVMECFAAYGFLPAGAFWSRDAMHFQATQ